MGIRHTSAMGGELTMISGAPTCGHDQWATQSPLPVGHVLLMPLIACSAGGVTIVPFVVTIALAILTQEVLPSLLVGAQRVLPAAAWV
jgi:hypothetical protein